MQKLSRPASMCGLMSLTRTLAALQGFGKLTDVTDVVYERSHTHNLGKKVGSVAIITDLLVLAFCVLPVSAGVQRVAEERPAGAATLLSGPRPDRHGYESGRHRRLRQIWYPYYTSFNVPI